MADICNSLDVLNGAVVWRAKGQTLNFMSYEPASMTLAKQIATINFEQPILACKRVQKATSDWLILISKESVALMELS